MEDPSIAKTLVGKYPAKDHCRRVISYLRFQNTPDTKAPTHFYLEAAQTRRIEDKDQDILFHQRRYFYYLTGCELPDAAFIYDVEKDHSTLFIPPVDPEEVIWSGMPMVEKLALERYDVNSVHTTSSLPTHLTTLTSSNPIAQIYTIPSQTTLLPALPSHLLNTTETLKTAISECRVTKSPYELALIRRANHVSSLAHKAAMRSALAAQNESELEAVFLAQCVRLGCRNQAYGAIVASGPDAATLHYVRNDKSIVREGEGRTLNVLLDAACEKDCYAADITRTFPVSGRFTKESKEIYSIVLDMQKQCMASLKAGAVWDDIHALAHRVLIKGFLELGIFKNGTEDEIFEKRTSVAFLPHGLGHYLGMDTHDTGGHADYSDPDPMFRYLRVRGKVPAGAVITVEPGIYFCRFLIEPYLKGGQGGDETEHSKYIDEEVLERYWEVGGVRIEDDVLVTEEGCENFTDVEVEIEDVEALVLGGNVGRPGLDAERDAGVR